MKLSFALHPAQQEIFAAPQRFKVVAAGRRFGKTYLARIMLVIAGMKTQSRGYNLCAPGKDYKVFYVAPTFNQAMDVMWMPLKQLVFPLGCHYKEKEGVIRLPNGREIHMQGADRPDNLRGAGLSFAVMDEYAQMKQEVWPAIIRPALTDVEGEAMFIGTPAGRNHFYDLFCEARKPERSNEWAAFSYKSVDNPFLKEGEIDAAIRDTALSAEYIRQEYEASFSAFGGTVFNPQEIVEIAECPGEGSIYMAVDLSGFDVHKKSGGKTLDQTAIAVAEVGTFGWYVHDIVHGRWDVRETAIRILRTAQHYRPLSIGIERGALKSAIMPYLHDNMLRFGVYPSVTEVSHGGRNKQARIQWALQGLMEQRRLYFRPGAYMRQVREEMADFPNRLAHDDALDALSYIAQLATVPYNQEDQSDEWQPFDAVAGF